MLRSKIIHLKETYKFYFDHFLEKRTVFILIEKTLLKIKSCGFRPNNARCEKMLRNKIVHLKKIYNFYFHHFLIQRTVFVLIVKNDIKNKKFNFLKNYRNINVKSSAKREYRDENVFLKGDRALSKLITPLISNKKEFNHFLKSRSSDIVLLKLGNLNQNAKRYEACNTGREARDVNLRVKRADFFQNESPLSS